MSSEQQEQPSRGEILHYGWDPIVERQEPHLDDQPSSDQETPHREEAYDQPPKEEYQGAHTLGNEVAYCPLLLRFLPQRPGQESH